jgi:vitamin B12 transporter
MFRFSALLLLSAASPALAQQAARPDAAVEPAAEDIVVSANRAPTAIDRVASSVTVLDKAAIDRNQDIGVADLLLRTPGVSLSRNGGYGTNTSLRIRGAETDQTVVVIDGVKLNDPSSAGGGYNFANLLVGDAARIEVLRGPQSILWGSQAIGGVVNVVTALPTRAIEGSFDVESGSRETVSGRAAIGGLSGPLAWRIGAQAFTTDGISAIAPENGGRERDGYTNRNVQGRGVLTLASGVSADLRGYHSDGRTDLDSTTGDTSEYSLNREFVGYAGLNVDLFDARLRNRIAYGYTNTDRDNYNPARARQQTFDAAGRNERIEYQGSLVIARGWDATFGVENERSRFRSVSPPASLATAVPAPARGRAEITGIYGQLNATIVDGLTLTGGVRYDDHSRFGDRTLFAGGGVWALPWGTVVRASYAEGFKAPTLFQLFSEFGNQALNPEEADGWEAGAEQRFMGGALAIGGTYFERRTTNQIIFNSCAANSMLPLCFQPGSTTRRSGYYQNVARAFAKGIEAVARLQVGARLLVDGNYSWTEAEDRSPGANNGRWLPRRPRHTANASATYTLPNAFSLGVAARWSGDTFDNAANTVKLDRYTLVDLRAEVPLSPEVRLFGRVENLFDETYQTAFRYNTLGRSVYAGLRGRF